MRRCVSSGGLSTLLTPRVAEDREQGAKPCAPYRGPDTLMTTLYSHQCADRRPMSGNHCKRDVSPVHEFRREDSAHEDSGETLSWEVHMPRRMQRGGRACRDSASSFDRSKPVLEDMSVGEHSEGNNSGDSDSSHCDLQTADSASDGVQRAQPPRANSLPKCLMAAPSNRFQQRRREQQGRATSQRLPETQESSTSDDGSEMDADCCGDSGAIIIKRGCGAGMPLPAITTVSAPAAGSALPARAHSLGAAIMRRTSCSDEDGESGAAVPSGRRELNRWHSGSCISEGQAAVELFYRLNHARQTVDYVRRQAAMYARLDRAEMGIWEALELLGTLREYETALLEEDGTNADLPLPEHAARTAEACRAAFPDLDWLHLVGLIHSLGKIIAHKRMGGQPQWAVCGESFPVGCRFHPSIVGSQFFSVNPDRRRRVYNSPTGIYRPGCGLAAVHMSWSASEYLYMVLLLNRVRLPQEALFLIRHQRFNALSRPGEPYSELLSEFDHNMVPWLARFKELSAYKRKPDLPGGCLKGDAFREYYDGLIRKYIPDGKLRW